MTGRNYVPWGWDPASYQWLNPMRPNQQHKVEEKTLVATSIAEATVITKPIPEDHDSTQYSPVRLLDNTSQHPATIPATETSNVVVSMYSVLNQEPTETQTTTSVVLESFALFLKLPCELKDMIFNLICAQPRVIDLQGWKLAGYPRMLLWNGTNLSTDTFHPIFEYRSQAQCPPSILHLSQQARNIGLKHYSQTFGTSSQRVVNDQIVNIKSPARVWVNWDCDIICLIIGSEWDSQLPCFLHQLVSTPENHTDIRRLALDTKHYAGPWIANILGLEELIVYPILTLEQKGTITESNFSRNILDITLVTMEPNENCWKWHDVKFGIRGLKPFIERRFSKYVSKGYMFSPKMSSGERNPEDWDMPVISVRDLEVHRGRKRKMVRYGTETADC